MTPVFLFFGGEEHTTLELFREVSLNWETFREWNREMTIFINAERKKKSILVRLWLIYYVHTYMKKDNLTDLVNSLPKIPPVPQAQQQVVNNAGEVVILGHKK